jgi:hypothetical protein
MRRPSWPQLTPPVPKTDEFGLPLRSHMGQVMFEPADEREKRLRIVRRFAFRAYRAVCRHLGEEQARKLFAGYISPSPREERARGPHDPRRAGELLAEYGRLAAKATTPAERAKLPGRVAESRVRGFENAAEADEKHLRRLLQRQERETALLLARSDRLRRRLMGDVQEPRTLLGQVLAERDKKRPP